MKQAIGLRTAKQFAAESGISKYYISRRLTGQYETPPRRSTLETIAGHAANGVTYEQLLVCCGYMEPSAKEKEPEGIIPSACDIKMAKACILSCAGDLQIPCTITSRSTQIPCDFELAFGNGPVLYWDFKCLPETADEVLIEQELRKSCLSLLFTRFQSYTKFSFVTGSREVFSCFAGKRPVNLDAETSILLCSPRTLEVMEEQALSKAVSDPFPEGLKFALNQEGL